jgi:hypothetical protein
VVRRDRWRVTWKVWAVEGVRTALGQVRGGVAWGDDVGADVRLCDNRWDGTICQGGREWQDTWQEMIGGSDKGLWPNGEWRIGVA